MIRTTLVAVLTLLLVPSLAFATGEPRANSEGADPELAPGSPESASWLELAKSKANELAEEHADTIEEILETFDQGAESAREFTAEAVESTLNSLSKNGEGIRDAGFDTTRIYVGLSVIPGAILHIEQIRILSPDEEKAVMEKYAEDTLMTFVLKTLFRAYEVEVRGYEVVAVRIHLNINPRATAILEKVPVH